MKDVVVIRNGEYQSQAKQDSGSLNVLATINHVEISELTIIAGKQLVVFPGEDYSVTEFMYVLEGELEEAEGSYSIHKGDSIYIKDLEKTVHFNVLKDVKVLYCSHESVIQEMGDAIRNLHEMVTQLEKKDHYTKEHSSRVVDWVPQLARKLSLDDKQVRILINAALFHDIGKLEIDNRILMKPTRLTEAEYARIQKHPGLGRIIAAEHNLYEVGEVIEQHHERIDGKGYPNGLKGSAIRIEAKIISVIDSFDAMTSDRPYRSGMSREVALAEIVKGRGTQFDSRVVDAFVEMMSLDR